MSILFFIKLLFIMICEIKQKSLLPLGYAAIVCGLLVQAPIAKGDINIATIDLAKILQESPEAKSKVVSIDKKATVAKATISKKQQELKTLQAKLGNDSKRTSADAENFRKSSRELQRYVRDTEEQLKSELLEVRKKVSEEALQKVQAIAKRNKIDLILEKSELHRGPVLFSQKTTDITDIVVAEMRK
jgi:Skp family chaperone for outer membrane proteins